MKNELEADLNSLNDELQTLYKQRSGAEALIKKLVAKVGKDDIKSNAEYQRLAGLFNRVDTKIESKELEATRLEKERSQQIINQVGQPGSELNNRPGIRQIQQQAAPVVDQAVENATGQEELSQKIALLQQLANTEQNVQTRNELNTAADQASAQLREKTKQYAKQAFRRVMIYIVDLIAMALDLSSATITIIIDWSIYLFTFSWLNLEMFYGRHLAKGKSKFIGPISWAPLKVPVDPNAIVLQSLIIAADIALAVAAGTLIVFGMAIMFVVVEVTKDPVAMATAGAVALLGAPTGLSGIIQILQGLIGL